MAGANALGGFVSLSAAESFAIEYWPLELYKLSLKPAPRELQGRVALVTGFDLDVGGAADAVAALGDAGLGVGGDVTSEIAVQAAFDAAIERFGGVDLVVSNAGIASSAPIGETTLAEWDRNHAILGTGYFLVARAAFRVAQDQRMGGSMIFVASKNALVAGKGAAAYSSAKAAELHLARCLAEEGGALGLRVNTVNPRRGVARLADLGVGLARGASRELRHRARRARGALSAAHDAARQHPAGGHRPGRAALRVRRALGEVDGQRAQRGRWRAGCLSAVDRA